jgi:citrate synthase
MKVSLVGSHTVVNIDYNNQYIAYRSPVRKGISMPTYLTAAEAASRLAVSRQTLYAYVSRGLLRAHDGDTARESRYLADDVERLANQRASGRKPKEVAQAVLDWGLPVLPSAITLIAEGKYYYRGQNAVTLADSHSVEQVAALLWQCPMETAFGPDAPAVPAIYPQVQAHYAGQRSEKSLLPLFTIASEDNPTAAWQKLSVRIAEGNGMLVRLMTACLLGTEPRTAAIHQQCADAWGLDAEGADLVRMALVLCADHELNASGFTARCVVSTGASLRAAVVAGLAALTGTRHGANTARVEAFWDEIDAGDEARNEHVTRLQQRLDRGDDLPGFGHHLYPAGDVRAIALLERILPHHPQWRQMIAAAVGLAGHPPSVDFALVALRRHLGLPPGAAFGIFALGRTLGWIAHAMEQRQTQQLIRPRAAYVGPRPTD